MTTNIVNISPAGIGWDIDRETWVLLCGKDRAVPIGYVDKGGRPILPETTSDQEQKS